MAKSLKRILSIAIVLVMVFGMVPLNAFEAFAAETALTHHPDQKDGLPNTAEVKGSNTAKPEDTEIPDGAQWEGPSAGVLSCTTDIHTHDESCYYKKCDHKDGHTAACFSETTEYVLCQHEDETQHTGSVTLTDVVTISGTNVSWKSDHPAYPAVYAVYKEAYDAAYASAKYFKEMAAKAAGVAALVNKTFCYTTSASAIPDLCTHTCSELGGDCYLKTCLKTVHPEHTEPDCYTYTWTLNWVEYDVDVTINNNTANVQAIDVPAKGTHSKDVTFKLSATHDENNTWTAMIGTTSFVLSATEPTTVTAYGITSGDIVVDLTSEPVPTYKVALQQENLLDGCNAAFEGPYESLLPGTDVVVNVTIPENTDAVYSYEVEVIGAAYTQVGNEITVHIAQSDATVKITYSVETLEINTTGQIFINGYLANTAKLTDLKAKVLTAAGLPTDGNYTVYMVVGELIGSGTREIDVTTSDTTSLIAMYTRFNVGDTQGFAIKDNDTQARGNITVSVKDSRLELSITASDLTVSGKTEPADLLAQIKGKVTMTAVDPVTGAVTNVPVEDSYIEIADYAWPADGQTGTFTVTVKANSLANETYSNAPSATLTLTCQDTTILYNITWDINGDKQTVSVAENTMPTEPTATRQYYTFDGWNKTVAAATEDTTYTATWKPTNDKNLNNNPDELDSFTVQFAYNGKVKEYTGLTLGDDSFKDFKPDAADAPEGKYFAGWDRTVVAVKAEDAESGSCVIIYNAAWNAKCTVTVVYGNGTEDGSELIVPGNSLELANPVFDQHIFAGWYVDGEKVNMPYTVENSVTVTAKWLIDLDRDNVEDGTTGDPYWTVTVDGVVVSTTTLNGEYATPDAPADQKNMFFVEWNKAVDDENHTIAFTALWNTNDSNDNNWDDANETVTVSQTGGTMTINGNVADGAHIYDSTKAVHTIVIKPADGYYVESLKINGAEFNIQPKSASAAYTNGVLTLSDVTLTNGMVIQVSYAQHKIPVVSEPSMKVNGYLDEKVASVTKKAVLEAILGQELTDDAVAQYEVKMYVNLGDYPLIGRIDGYYDIWKLTSGDYGKEINAALKSALAKAIDVGGAENFEITWLSHGQYPAVTQTVAVNLEEARTPTQVVHNGNTYTASNINDALLDEIKVDLSSPNSTISQVVWADNSGVSFEAGQTVTVKVTVSVLEDATVYGGTHTISVTVNVPYTEASVVVPDNANLIYNTGMTDADKAALVLQVLDPQITPALPAEVVPTVWYLASEARNVDMTINLGQMDLGLYSVIVKNLIGDSVTIQIPVDNMWLNIGDDLTIPEMPSNERIEEILMNDLIPNYGADFISGQLSADQMTTVLANTLKKYPDIAEYYKYLGAHQFGEEEQEKVYITVPDYGYGAAASNTSVLNLTDTRAESEIKLNSGVEVTYNSYSEAELLALILDGVYVDGQKIDGLTVQFVTDTTRLPVSDASEVTVKFAGNKDYKPSTATVAIKINKATVNVSVDNRLFKWQAGQFYTIQDVVSTNPAGVATINFVAGLNLNGVNIDGGLKGFVAQVQLLLPDELQALLESANGLLQAAGLDISFADGASMKLSELKTGVDALDDIVAGSEYDEYFSVLLNMLSSLPTEVADIEIIIGGKMPTDIGAYVVGAISADANYTTDFGVGAVVIYPDGTKVDLAWNQNDENYIITNTLLSSGAFDTGAHATKVYDDRFTLEQATEQVAEIFLGVDIDGNITFEMDQKKLNVGAYVELAMIVQFGNEMFYAVPLVRPVVVVAETLDVDFVDATGAVNNERHYEFFNIPQNGMEDNLLVTYKKDGNGYQAGDEVTGYAVKYIYVGVQTNGKPYASQEAPVHAGVYTITAMVTIRDNTGYITHAGQGIGALVIEPSKSTIHVENEAIKWDGKAHTFNQYVTAGSVNVPAITPDTTILTAGINADLDADIGLSAINGTVNVDMPVWLDNLMNKLGVLEAGYAEGITVAEFKTYVEKIKTGLAELGFDSEAFNKIAGVIDQLDGKVVLTFHDNKGYQAVGVYLVIGIVTDSDHYPSVDAGVVVIYPDATKVELKFEKDWNDNNIFTWTALQNMNLDAQAYNPGTDDVNAEANALVKNLYLGFTDDGKVILTGKKAELDNGVYSQVAFLVDLGNEMYYAEPIARAFVILPTPAELIFVDDTGSENHDRHFVFDNQPHEMAVKITVNGKVVTDRSGLTVQYVGVQTNGELWNSTQAPTHAGAYTVTATYTARDEQNRLVTLGVAVGAMVIEPANATIDVESKLHKYNGTGVNTNDMVTVNSGLEGVSPDKTVISVAIKTDGTFSENMWSAVESQINIDLPAWADALLAQIDGVQDGITVQGLINAIEKAEAKLEELAAQIGVDAKTDAFDALIKVLEQMPADYAVTFMDAPAYTDVGSYLVIGVVTDSDFYPTMDAGILVIYPDVDKAELKWNYIDGNGIYTLPALSRVDMSASAYFNNVLSQVDTAKIDYLTVGVDEFGKVVVTTMPGTLTGNGIYTQVAYVPLELNSQITVAAPIMRSFVVVPQTANVEMTNIKAVYGEDYQMPVTVTDMDNNPITGERLNNVTFTYINLATGYYSTVKPTDVGSYTVVAVYEERIENDLAYYGMTVANLIIVSAEPDYTMTDKDQVCNTDNTIDSMITNTNDLPYAIYVVKNVEKGEVNVILPDGWEITLDVGATVDDLLDALEKLPAAVENTKIVEGLKAALNSVDMQTLTINGAQPNTCGRYEVAAVAFGDKNYHAATASGVLTIAHGEDANKDHNCDSCGEYTYGVCEDTDKDHACDYGCDKVFGTCEDTDKDHACDYGCDKVYGTCEDADKDHACDYGCDKVYGTCEDADKDHACDYGCDKTFGTCEDTDKDHACDYGCDKVYGTCEDADKDHACDYGCDKVYGTCEDADKDHACDYGCDKAYGTCEDADKDHACDYGCDKAYGTCEDADKDHACDYGCDKVYGTCEDADKDHACDYGCDKVYGTCEDTDKDHACDYGCDKAYGTCEDTDNDHACDYGCDKAYGTCEDTDKDHACDYGCDKTFGTCEDTDKDHACDYGCDKVYGTCEDADKDHACDYGCDKAYGTCEDADKDHACDYGCDKVYGTCEDADKDHTCDYGCDKVYGTCEDTDKDHKCDYCGATMGQINDPVIGIPALTGDNIYGFAVDYENKRIYIDTVKTGLTVEQFAQQLNVPVFNDTDDKAEVVVSYGNEALTGTELIRTEAKVSLTAENENGKTTVVYDVVVIGDVNRNGEVDSGDAALIQRYFFKEVKLTDLQADAADTNRSGETESGDAVKNQVKYNDAANYQSNLHSYTEHTSNGDATCEEDGTMTIKCTANHRCSAKSITVPEAGSAKGHNYVDKNGTYVCDTCGKKKLPNV